MPLSPQLRRRLNADVLQAVHLEQLAEHGSGAGTRDKGLLDAGLDRPQHLAPNGETDAFELAAARAFGIAKKHPFIDGNQRTADVAMELFLLLNGFELTVDDASATRTMLSVAAGDIDEPTLAQWLRGHSAPH